LQLPGCPWLRERNDAIFEFWTLENTFRTGLLTKQFLMKKMLKDLPLAFGVVLNFLGYALNAEDMTMTEA
jgi:hypothetical protein